MATHPPPITSMTALIEKRTPENRVWQQQHSHYYYCRNRIEKRTPENRVWQLFHVRILLSVCLLKREPQRIGYGNSLNPSSYSLRTLLKREPQRIGYGNEKTLYPTTIFVSLKREPQRIGYGNNNPAYRFLASSFY